MTVGRQYVIPITLPFSEEEAVKLLSSVGYQGFAIEAVQRSQVLCTSDPKGRRLTVEEAMRLEVADALKRMLTAEGSPLRLPTSTGASETPESATPPVQHDTITWALREAAEFSNHLDVLVTPVAHGDPLEVTGAHHHLRAAEVAGYVKLSRHSAYLTPAGVTARQRLIELAHAVVELRDGVFVLRQLRTGEPIISEYLPDLTWRTLQKWGVLVSESQERLAGRLTCVGRAIGKLIIREHSS